ncbi:phospholipid:diacylglycerol acyltransferase [Nematocida sp. AWRm80]|nr:phospholipid:diacylglycerol acyltransferase [Nematocida sp. AWRm80]
MSEKKSKKEKKNNQLSDSYIDDKCYACGQKRPKRKKRYFLIAIAIVLLGYFCKIFYEKAFKRAIITKFVEDLLQTKAVTSLNLSTTTKSNLIRLAELAAASPDTGINNRPGIIANKSGLKMKHPITIIPGIANSNLELWKTKEDCNSFFRKKIWGSHSTLTFILHNRAEWFASMKIDAETGEDPPETKVRPTAGLESSDFTIPGLWFWWKIIENLSHIGYDIAGVHFAAFDWRLGMDQLEARDGYFTKLKTEIECQNLISKEKSVVIAHSMGGLVFHYFMQWVTETDKSWVDKNIHAVAYIAPALLGAPKTVACLLSGDSKDTTEMGIIPYAIVEMLFRKDQRKELFRTWPSFVYLLPKGGERIWNITPDGKNTNRLLTIIDSSGKKRVLSHVETLEAIRKLVTPHNKRLIDKILSTDNTLFKHPNSVLDFKRNASEESGSQKDSQNSKDFIWSNPLLSPLPHAPNLTIYTLYGVGHLTEVGYSLNMNKHDHIDSLEIDKTQNDPKTRLNKGIILSDGDGTVPIVSSGYMGYSGWKTKKLNPSGVKTVNKEYVHGPSRSILDIRGGPETSQHIHILGNFNLISDLLKIAAGKTIKQKITSQLPKVAQEIDKASQKESTLHPIDKPQTEPKHKKTQ